MHAAGLLDDIGSELKRGENGIDDVLLMFQNKVHDHFADDERYYALLAELKALAYTGQALHAEVNNNAGHTIMNWKWWHAECLSPFLENISFRLGELAEEFHIALFHEWQLEPRKPHGPITDEIAEEKREKIPTSKPSLEDSFLVDCFLQEHRQLVEEMAADVENDDYAAMLRMLTRFAVAWTAEGKKPGEERK